MKARRLAIIAFALVAVLTIGVGYAALNDALSVTGIGSISKATADDLFDGEVYFTGVTPDEKCAAALADVEKPDSATITIEDSLAIVGDYATATFTVKNESAVPVTIVTNTSTDSDHFRVTAEYPDGNSLAAGEEMEITVKVVLKTTVGDEGISNESFGISFNASSAG